MLEMHLRPQRIRSGGAASFTLLFKTVTKYTANVILNLMISGEIGPSGSLYDHIGGIRHGF